LNDRKFTNEDELKLHQLDILRRVATGGRIEGEQLSDAPRRAEETGVNQSESCDWGLSPKMQPYPWQNAALEEWEKAGQAGIVKVVTGAGKTVFALMCLEQLLRKDTDVRTTVVVPTRVLLDQWYQELTGTLNLPPAWVGRRSTDYSDEFDGDRRVMIYVVNSAREALGKPISDDNLRKHHFLIVDECHRAGSKENARIFERPRCFSLGLSATPEREYEDAVIETLSEDEIPDVVQTELGGIIYELSFGEALKEGIIPPFELIHCAVRLTPKERAEYDKFTREMDKVRDELKSHPEFLKRSGRGGNEFQLIKWIAKGGKGHLSKLAARYEFLTSRRKELLYRAENRKACFRDILNSERSYETRIMSFHERVNEVNALYAELMREGLPVVLDHNELTQTQREESLSLYLRGIAPILLSVKALIEGVNAPATDVGIIVASSASPRQKIQSIGRVLRTYPGKEMSRIF
jgi:superfamily II DNA or RNA helicase